MYPRSAGPVRPAEAAGRRFRERMAGRGPAGEAAADLPAGVDEGRNPYHRSGRRGDTGIGRPTDGYSDGWREDEPYRPQGQRADRYQDEPYSDGYPRDEYRGAAYRQDSHQRPGDAAAEYPDSGPAEVPHGDRPHFDRHYRGGYPRERRPSDGWDEGYQDYPQDYPPDSGRGRRSASAGNPRGYSERDYPQDRSDVDDYDATDRRRRSQEYRTGTDARSEYDDPAGYHDPGQRPRDDQQHYRQDPITDPEGTDAVRAQGGRRGSHLPPYTDPAGPARTLATPPGTGGRAPRKLTVTRVAALRSRELTHRGVVKFHGAVSADGADRSGLTHLTYAVMANYAVDAALAVSLANTLFFAAAKADSTGKVLLYLLLTVAPFAVIAPLIGPLLDRIQNGRRLALSVSSFGRAVLAMVMALNFDSWIIYPCALGMLVLSKGFGVLKAALTPRVLPEQITLVKTNSRLSVFGLIAGGVAGAIAAGLAALINSPGALVFTAICGVVGGWLCLRIPAWVESTAGEVPIRQDAKTKRRRVFPRSVTSTLWTNGTIRVETGFLALFIAFVIKSEYQPSSSVVATGAVHTPPTDHSGLMQLLVLGAIGAAAGLGGFLGNALGARLPLRTPETVSLFCLGAVLLAVLVAFSAPGLITAGVVALVGSTSSSLAKVCLDSVIQHNLPEASRASAFGRSESVLQLCWVFGGVLGLLIGGVWSLHGHSVYLVGFGVIGGLLTVGTVQCVMVRMGRTLLPALHLPKPRVRRSSTPTAPLAGAATGFADGSGTLATPTTRLHDAGSSSARSADAGPKRTPRRAGKPR